MSFFDRFKDIPIDDDDDTIAGNNSADSASQATHDDEGPAAPESARISFENGINSGGNHTVESQPTRRRRGCGRWLVFIVVLAVGCAVAFYLRYMNPYVTDARERVYVERVERRGIIFKTFEVDVLVPRMIADTTRTYSRNNSFSVANDSLALELQQMQNTGQLIEITYETFYATLPWRGGSRSVITAVR